MWVCSSWDESCSRLFFHILHVVLLAIFLLVVERLVVLLLVVVQLVVLLWVILRVGLRRLRFRGMM